jgi:hypothetical protein
MIVSHSVSGFVRSIHSPPCRAVFGLPAGLPHLIRRFDPEQRETRGKHSDNSLHQSQARHCRLWIILDNEA